MISANIQQIIDSCGETNIVVASKYMDAVSILEMTHYGLFNYGENRVDALLSKIEALKDHKEIHWHFIGHLQSNKAKLVANQVECLHSLDSLKVARIISEERTTPLDCYIELHLTDNDAKSGVKMEDLQGFLDSLKAYPNIHVIGFMAMSDADMSDEEKLEVFKRTKSLADQYGYSYTSMGMSDDYLLAIQAGSSTVRLGRILLR